MSVAWKNETFLRLDPPAKLLYLYLIEQTDDMGFIENPNFSEYFFYTGLDKKYIEETIQNGLKNLAFYSKDSCQIFIPDYLFEKYEIIDFEKLDEKLMIFSNQKSDEFNKIKTAFLVIYNNILKEKIKERKITPLNPLKERKEKKAVSDSWKNNFDVYLKSCKEAFTEFYKDSSKMEAMKRLYPGVNIKRTLDIAYTTFWGTEAGWEHKKRKRATSINWSQTITNAIKLNKSYFTKEEINELNRNGKKI